MQELDPSAYMTKKEKKAWNRLSDARQERYKEQGIQSVKYYKGKRGIARSDQIRYQQDRMNARKGRRGRSVVYYGSQETFGNQSQMPQQNASYLPYGNSKQDSRIRNHGRQDVVMNGPMNPYEIQRRNHKNQVRQNTNSFNYDVSSGTADYQYYTDVDHTSGYGNSTTMATTAGTIDTSSGALYSSAATDIINEGTKATTETATETATGAATGGASVAVRAARKTAEKFKEDLLRQTEAMNQHRNDAIEKMESAKENSANMGTLSRGAAIATAAMGVAIFTVAAFVLQVIAMALIALIAIFLAVILVTVIITTIISLIAGLFDSNDVYYTGYGGDAIVAVALQEVGYTEGAGNKTKYGQYTGTNGLAWCHAFVSWCGNECGFIDSGIMPKTAACETGRQWYISHGEYQESNGSYIPQPGDIIYFDFKGEGESHHVGIVEFSEGGIVHTIEGNHGSKVAQNTYDIKSPKIMGYGQPAYPEDGYEAMQALEFLSKCQELANEIGGSGKWIYSNHGCSSTWAGSKRVKKTNCAHYASLCMQEFGTLKKGQTFYSGTNHELTCSDSVKKQIRKYYDIIDVGGKSPKDIDLKPGDVCLYNAHVNIFAGKNASGKYTWYDFGRDGTTDHKADSGHFSRILKTSSMGSQKIYTILRLKVQDTYGSGKTFMIPSNLGDSYTYMGWTTITSKTSPQYKMREQSGQHYDSKGFARIGGRYVIACTPTFGVIGDHLDFVLSNGKVVHGIMGDEKNMNDKGCNMWGHDNGHSVLEFVVSKSNWYGSGKDLAKEYPAIRGARVVKVINLGKNYFK